MTIRGCGFIRPDHPKSSEGPLLVVPGDVSDLVPPAQQPRHSLCQMTKRRLIISSSNEA